MIRTLIVATVLALSASVAHAAPLALKLNQNPYKTAKAAAAAGGAYALSRAYRTAFHAADMSVSKTRALKNGAARYAVDDGNGFSATLSVYKVKGGYKFDRNTFRSKFFGFE
jgi:hypothetical protein